MRPNTVTAIPRRSSSEARYSPAVDQGQPTASSAVRSGREQAGIALLVAGGWLAPWVVMAGAFWPSAVVGVVGGALGVTGLLLIITGEGGAPERSLGVGLAAAAAVALAIPGFALFPFGPAVIIAPLVFGVAIVVFLARAPRSGARATSASAVGLGFLLLLGASAFAAFEGFVWSIETLSPDLTVEETLAYLDDGERQAAVSWGTIWAVATAAGIVAFVVWGTIVSAVRVGGTRVVGALALCLAAAILIGMNFGSFPLGWELTDHFKDPDMYIGGHLRHGLAGLCLTGGSLLAFWPSPARNLA